MSNLEKTLKKSSLLARMEQQIEILEQVEMRMLLSLACYEAVYGGIPIELVRRTNELLHGKRFANRQEMYEQMLSCAKTVQIELEFEAAVAGEKSLPEAPDSPNSALALGMVKPPSAFGNQDT